jgi:hypothetical protein
MPARFKEVFPAADPLARWVLIVCLARDDIVTSIKEIIRANEEDDGTNLHWARITAAHLYEAALMLRRSHGAKEVRDLIACLPSPRQDDLKSLLETTFLKGVLAGDRNLTFHYPSHDTAEVGKGGGDLESALRDLQDRPVELSVEYDDEGKPAHYRYRFADEVAAAFSAMRFGDTEKAMRDGIELVQERAFAFARFADAVFAEWGKRHGLTPGQPRPSDAPTS